jgi:hypothetical protein
MAARINDPSSLREQRGRTRARHRGGIAGGRQIQRADLYQTFAGHPEGLAAGGLHC